MEKKQKQKHIELMSALSINVIWQKLMNMMWMDRKEHTLHSAHIMIEAAAAAALSNELGEWARLMWFHVYAGIIISERINKTKAKTNHRDNVPLWFVFSSFSAHFFFIFFVFGSVLFYFISCFF